MAPLALSVSASVGARKQANFAQKVSVVRELSPKKCRFNLDLVQNGSDPPPPSHLLDKSPY